MEIKKSWNTVEPEPEELFLEPLETREESEAAKELMYEMKNERTFREPPRPRPLTRGGDGNTRVGGQNRANDSRI